MGDRGHFEANKKMATTLIADDWTAQKIEQTATLSLIHI